MDLLDFTKEDIELFTSKVTISVKKRNGRQFITNVIGMAEDLDLPKILSYLKKKHNCNGSITTDKEHGEIMSFSGVQAENIFNFFVDQEIYNKGDIIIRGV